jgi:hypothetical protein
MIALLRPNWVTEAGMFWGILLAAIPGETLFVYGKLFDGGNTATFTGTMITTLGAPVAVLLISAMTKGRKSVEA